MIRHGTTGCLGVLAAGVFASAAAAQHPSELFHPAGPGVAIVLPQRVVAGQPATLGVLDAAGRLTPKTVVEFSGDERVTTDATGRATFLAPAEPGVLLARLPGRGVSASTIVVVPQPNAPEGTQVTEHPHFISVSDRFFVEGSGFRGEADANHVLLGDQPALVLAASPVALVLLAGPRVSEGPTQLQIEVAGRSARTMRVSLVSLGVTATKKQLTAGEKGRLIVHVLGTEQRLVIEARNLSPQVVELPRGNVQRVTSSGGPANKAEIEMQGVRAGDFAVSVRLVPGAYGLPDIEAVRQHLLAARQLAPANWQARVDHVLRRIERNPQEVSRLRNELERLLAEKPEGEFGREMEAAWRELLKR